MCYMITVIAAVAENNAIGKNNDLIWSLSADLKRFKKVTTGHYILMGRNTFESIGRPLPNRTTIIITRNKSYFKEGSSIVFSRSLGIKRNSIVLPKGYELTHCNYPSQVDLTEDARIKISFLNLLF